MSGVIKGPSASLKVKDSKVSETDDSAKISAYGQSLNMGPDGVTNSISESLKKIKDYKIPLEVMRNAAEALHKMEESIDELPDKAKKHTIYERRQTR